jgi:hypothetical protein
VIDPAAERHSHEEVNLRLVQDPTRGDGGNVSSVLTRNAVELAQKHLEPVPAAALGYHTRVLALAVRVRAHPVICRTHIKMVYIWEF